MYTATQECEQNENRTHHRPTNLNQESKSTWPKARTRPTSSLFDDHACIGHKLSKKCVGCAIVQADNAPDCGVAQGVIHGVTVRHGEKQEEEEGELDQEVERDKEEERSNNNAHDHG